jgi:hypothetical protein
MSTSTPLETLKGFRTVSHWNERESTRQLRLGMAPDRYKRWRSMLEDSGVEDAGLSGFLPVQSA